MKKQILSIKTLFVNTITIVAVMMFIVSCNKSTNSNTSSTYISDVQAFGSDSIRSWVKADGNGTPISVGVTFKASALSKLPKTDTMYMLMLPKATGGGMGMGMNMKNTAFDHIEVAWSANGDPSPSKYNTPHLDAHFFTITMDSEMGIMGGMDSVQLGSNYIPKNCIADGDAEAGMGVHYIDTTAHEYHGSPFDATYNYGFYHGNMTFMEVLCAKTFLNTKSTTKGSFAQPNTFKMGGYYPGSYIVSYDAATDSYTYSLDGFMMH